MKKLISLFLMFTMITVLASCGDNGGSNPSTPIPNESTSPVESTPDVDTDVEDLNGIEVDDGIFNVELTIPADFVGGTTQEGLNAISAERGYKSATLNDDGSITYVMTHRQHRELMADIDKSIRDNLAGMEKSEDYPRFVSISANDDFTSYTVKVDGSELEFGESFSTLGFFVYSGMYYAFLGESADGIEIIVQYINAETGEIIEEANSSNMGSGS